MAIELTTSEQKISTATLSRDGCNFELKTYAWYTKDSSTVARVHVKMTIQCQANYTWSGTNNWYRCWSDGKFDSGRTKRTNNVTSTKATIGTWEYTKTTSNSNTINSRWEVYDGQYATQVSADVYVPNSEFATAPSTPSATVKALYTNGAMFGVSVSSYGNPSSASGRYIEACISSTNDYFGTRRYGTSGNVSSADIVVTNTSGAAGDLNIQPNSRYYYGAYANNTQLVAYTMIGQLVTLPPALSAKSATVTGTSSIRVNYTTTADGGWYAKNIQYNIGNGWVTGATVSAAAATSGNFTISGLSTGTYYTINLRVTTSSGSTDSGSVSATTYKIPANATVSAANYGLSNAVTYGVTTFNTGPNPGVYLYGGTAASPTTQLTWKNTTGDATYTHSNLTGNTKYYYRARAKNDGGWSSYSSDATAITSPAAPTLAVAIAGGQKQEKVTLTITSPSQGSAATMTAYYTVNGGSAISAGTVGSGGSVTANITTSPQTTYTIVAYLSNSSGSSSTVTKTITTGLPLYCRVSDSRKTVKKLYCSVNGQAKKVQHLYGAVAEPVLDSVSGTVASGGSGNVTAFNSSTFMSTAAQNSYLYNRVIRGGKTVSRIYFQFTDSDTWAARIYFTDNTIANIGHSSPVPSPSYMDGDPITDYSDLGITASFVETGSDDIDLSGTYTTGYFAKKIF